MSRGELLSDLGRAVLPESARSVLVVFGFAGLKGYLRSAWDANSLLDRLAARLTQAVGDTGRLYTPRRGELAALFEGGLDTSFTMIPAALDEEVSRWVLLLRDRPSVSGEQRCGSRLERAA